MAKARGKPARVSTRDCERTVLLRMPSSLHRRLCEATEGRDISINRLILDLINKGVPGGVATPATDNQSQSESVASCDDPGKSSAGLAGVGDGKY